MPRGNASNASDAAASVYLDHAATTPMRESARDAWLSTVDQLQRFPGNPGALHSGGRTAKRLLEDARERLATALGAERAEVVFTSGATESAALGVVGAATAFAEDADGSSTGSSSVGGSSAEDFSDDSPSTGGHRSRRTVAVSAVEHPAVANQESVGIRNGLQWQVLPVSSQGVTVLDFEGRESQVALASMCWVCSETGVIQPVPELVTLGARNGFLVHSDATQAVGNLDVDFGASGLDLMTIGGHKFGAPVGTGALLVKRGVRVTTDRPGGDQERKIRSGTPDVAGAVALSVAAEEAAAQVASRTAAHRELRERLIATLPSDVRATQVGAAVEGIVHLSLPTRHPEVVLLELDRAGVMASAGSACHAGVTRPSAVLLAMGRSQDEALGVLRVSFGATTTDADIERLVAALPRAVDSAQKMDALDR